MTKRSKYQKAINLYMLLTVKKPVTIPLILLVGFIVLGSLAYFISWKIGLLMTVSAPLVLLVNRSYGKKLRVQSTKARNSYGTYVSWIFEILKGLLEVRLLSAEKIILGEFSKKFNELTKINEESSIVSLKVSKMVDGIRLISGLSLYALCGCLAFKGELTLGVFVAVREFYNTANNQMKYLSENNMDMHNRLVSVEKIYNFLTSDTEEDWEGTEELRISEGNLVLSGITFSYDKGAKVLEDISLNIQGGSHVSIVGVSGAGKSTLINLILGYYKPGSGKIKVDGMDISKCSIKSLRSSIGVVSQEVLIFEETIRNNLRMGRPDASSEELMAACDCAAIGDFVKNLPDGLDTKIGRSGIGLSGGQKQRLSIARIYLKNPKILIFDEAPLLWIMNRNNLYLSPGKTSQKAEPPSASLTG